MIPKISIIIPVYNVEKYLKQCLDTVINQTLEDIEIIIVNDGSTDNSIDIIEEYEKKDSRIIFINQENHGPGSARNSGLNIAKGEYILFIDSDDWIKEETSQELYKIVKRDNNIELVFFQYTNYDDEKDIFYEEKFDSQLKQYIDKTFAFKDVSNYYLPPSPVSKFYKKSLIEENNIRFPEDIFFEDKPFHTEILLKAKKIYFTDKNFYIRRRRQSSITGKADNKLFDSVEISNLVVKAYKKHGKYQEYKNSVISNKISYLKYCYGIILDEYKQEYLKLLAKDFDKIKEDKESYEEYTNCLYGIYKEFFINVDKRIKYQDLDNLLSEYRIETKIKVNPIKSTIKGQKITIKGTLTDTNNNPLTNTQLKIQTNNTQKTIKTDNKGQYNTTIQLNKTGTHNITIQYQGNNTYQKTTAKTTIEVTKEKTKIMLDPIEKVFKGDEIVLSGFVSTCDNKSISNVQIKIFINDSPKTLKVDEKGFFNFKYKMNRVGINDVKIKFSGNNTYDSSTLSMKVEVFNK